MQRHRFSVLIPDAQSGHALVVARCLAAANVKVFALGAADRTALRYSRRQQGYWTIPEPDRQSSRALLAYIKDKILLTGADVYFPVDEKAHRFAIEHREELAGCVKLPPLATLESFDMLTRKDRLGDFLVRENLPAPGTFRINESGGQFDLSGDYSFPLIAKPSQGDGGKGIRLIPGAKELEDFYQDPERRRYGHYILQEYIRGYDIDCSVLAVNGEIAAYTIQVGLIARQRAYAAPGGVQFLHEAKLLDVVSRMIKSARFSGIAHVDARYDEESGEFKIIEVNARYWGSLTASLQAGVNFPYLATQLACGRSFSPPSYAEVKYIDLLTYTKRLLRCPRGRATSKFRISETDLRHFASDPIAEAVNVFLRRAG